MSYFNLGDIFGKKNNDDKNNVISISPEYNKKPTPNGGGNDNN